MAHLIGNSFERKFHSNNGRVGKDGKLSPNNYFGLFVETIAATFVYNKWVSRKKHSFHSFCELSFKSNSAERRKATFRKFQQHEK